MRLFASPKSQSVTSPELRPVSDTDYATLVTWWQARGWAPVPADMLPMRGFIVPGIAAGFLYETDSKIAWIEWLISNPASDKSLRDQAINAVIERLLGQARGLGFEAVFTSSNLPALATRLESHGFTATDRGVVQFVRRF